MVYKNSPRALFKFKKNLKFCGVKAYLMVILQKFTCPKLFCLFNHSEYLILLAVSVCSVYGPRIVYHTIFWDFEIYKMCEAEIFISAVPW